MIKRIIVGESIQFVVFVRIKLHYFKQTIKQNHGQSVVKASNKVKRITQKDSSEAIGLLVLEFYKSHVLLTANWDKITVFNWLLINSFDRCNFLPMISYARVNMIHVLDRQKDNTAFVATYSNEFMLFKFFLEVLIGIPKFYP